MAKDKLIGALVIILGLVIAVIYTMGSLIDLLFDTIWYNGGIGPHWDDWTNILGIDWLSWELFVVAPIWLLVILISVIAIWIGYSMLTTPAPVPLEELEEELAAEEEAE